MALGGSFSSITPAYLLDRRLPKTTSYAVLFSTDIQQTAEDIYRLYRLRFQIEFIFRDAKQFTGLSDCQARDAEKLDFHFNVSFTALNLAKLDVHRQHSGHKPFVFSIVLCQTSRSQRTFAGNIYFKVRPGANFN